MATYIKGADTYLPDIKPFTPDYKFLSAVLETRTDKYDANFKATNDLYNKVVYADLSREDNKTKRDQYAETIAPAIEKISGMDLSLQQNADNARSVFAPFYEDDLIVKDIVYTSAYRKEMAHAQRLLDQGTEVAADRYSERGKRSLQYQLDDFINADANKALNMKLPNYVQNVNLYKMSEKILGEMDPPLKMKMDQFSEDGNYIITNQNGSLVTGAALQILQQTLMKDPRVQAAYADDAFVASRDFAANGMQAGAFQTVEEGQNAWAAETINRINQRNDLAIQAGLEDQAKQININANWENYQKQNGIIPGSDMSQALEENLSVAEATQAALDARMNIKREGQLPTNSVDGNLNKAYRMLMGANIETDLVNAAISYGARDQEHTIRVNERKMMDDRFRYDMAKIRANAENDLNLAKYKADREEDLAAKKGELIGSQGNPLGNALTDTRVNFGDGTTITGAVDDEGNLDPNTDLIERTNTQFLKEDSKIFNDQLEDSLAMMQLLNPTGDNASQDQTYGVTLSDGSEYRGTIEEIRKKLSASAEIDPEDENAIPVYDQRVAVENLFGQLSTEFKDTRQRTLDDPSLTMGTDKRNQYDALYEKVWGLNGTINKRDGLDQFMTTALGNHKAAYDLSAAAVLKEDDGDNIYVQMAEAGFPPIMNDNGTLMNYEEYEELVLKGVKEGNISNPNLKWKWDTGTNNEDYMIPAYEMVREYDPVYGQYVERAKPIYNKDGSRARMIDERAVKDEASRFYQKNRDVLNMTLTSGKVASGDLYSTAYGRSDAKGIDVVMAPTYEYTLDPLSPNPQAEAEMVQLIKQLNTLDNAGTGYGIIQGDIDAANFFGYDDVQSMMQQDPTAMKAWNLFKADLNTWYNNPKRSNTAKIAPRATIQYMPSYGKSDDPTKSNAGYRVIFSPDWLASKKQGSNTASGTGSEFGALTTDEINSLTGASSAEDGVQGTAGVSFIIPQEFDGNTKSIDNLYYSNVETAILAGNNGYAEFEMPEGLSPTGTYRVIKTGTNQYNLHYSINTYVPGGTYTTRTETQPINMQNGLRGLDIHIANFDKFLRNKREENRLAREKDNAENGQR